MSRVRYESVSKSIKAGSAALAWAGQGLVVWKYFIPDPVDQSETNQRRPKRVAVDKMASSMGPKSVPGR